jgi:hypothetical protein
MSYDVDHPVITIATTIMDGTVVRWFASVDAATNMRPALSASCHGVAVHAQYLSDIPHGWVVEAFQAHRELAANPSADLRHLATHRHRGALNGPLEEVPHA